jgi:signal transduction histidine kinase/CheY-like chemotaxis protein
VWLNFEVRGKSVRIEDGKPRIVLNARDITARRQLEERLRETQRMESIGRLAGGIAHDYNNLLATILANCELMLEEVPPDPDLRASLEDILHAGRRAADLTHQLLAFGRRQVLKPTTLDIGTILRETEPRLRELLGPKISLQVKCLQGSSVEADGVQLRQVLVSLAENARDAMPRGGRLSIEAGHAVLTSAACRLRPGIKPGPYVLITVRDTGGGMSPEIAAHIFEPFFTTKGPGRNADLGLATIHGIIVQSGGGIEVESMLGHGTTFRILLPRAQGAPATSPATPPSSAALTGMATILLVEDDAAVRHITARLLKRLGYKVLTAAEPDEAVAITREHPGHIALAISDVSLPGMDGPTLVRHLREIRPGMRVVLTSGYAAETAIPGGRLDGDAVFLMKPFAIAELSQVVQHELSVDVSGHGRKGDAPIGPVNGAERPVLEVTAIVRARRNWLPERTLPLGNEAA